MSDFYNTIKGLSTGIFKDKGSKFLSFGYAVEKEEEIKSIVDSLKKKYHDARHHCYAYRIGTDDTSYRMNDDGEPSGTAGKPIYGQLLSNNLSDTLIVVVRYFGGTLLGTSGLINAYKNATANCIENAEIVEKIITKPVRIKFKYDLLNTIMRFIKDNNVEIDDQLFTDICSIDLKIRLGEFESVTKKISGIYGVKIDL